jgi:hypothetical protein
VRPSETTFRKSQERVRAGACGQQQQRTYLGVQEVRPETGDGTVVGVGRQDGRPVEGLVDVLDDEEGLADGPVAMEEHGHLLVDRVLGEQQLALVAQVFLDQLVRHALEPQSGLDAVRVRARVVAEDLDGRRHVSCYSLVGTCLACCLLSAWRNLTYVPIYIKFLKFGHGNSFQFAARDVRANVIPARKFQALTFQLGLGI